jgi:hypothetical protein
VQGIGLLLILIAAGIFVLVYGMRLRAQRVARLAELYEKALASGADLEQIRRGFDEMEQGDPQGNLKAGILLLAAALGMVAGLWAGQHLRGPWGAVGFAFVPAALGAAALFIHYAVPRK